MSATSDHFPTEVAGLPEAHSPELVELADGDRFELRIAPMRTPQAQLGSCARASSAESTVAAQLPRSFMASSEREPGSAV
jgi:hypothetical protein